MSLQVKFDPSEMEVIRNGRLPDCTHGNISTNGFGTKGVCVYCGALIAAKELPPPKDRPDRYVDLEVLLSWVRDNQEKCRAGGSETHFSQMFGEIVRYLEDAR